ncbi:MAG: hypothetical protein A2W98_00980 [Bacteroidetes bacterium GWF2_33_38]|nr:MAG: hypothetical protein A2W98_00980 [Bacteroidetes bacterium GWF2_33_38]OFY92371.1 MAG: hypothetical protein A2236_00970 [Bacteroidetes bacterium RIFOXYA2_FULL_33_7]HBX50632.1 hypothetical protein [Bacteroidales bacterium]
MKNKFSLIFSSIAIVAVMVVSGCGSSEQKGNDVANALEDLQKELETLETSNLYESIDGNFKVNFPAEPKVESQSIPTEVGNIEMVSFMYEKSATEAYMVAYSDYPSAMVEASDAKTLLEGVKSGFTGDLQVSVIEEKEIKLGENPGIFFKANSESYFVVFKDYLVKNRLYQIGILRDGSFPNDEAVKAFIDSFELINK